MCTIIEIILSLDKYIYHFIISALLCMFWMLPDKQWQWKVKGTERALHKQAPNRSLEAHHVGHFIRPSQSIAALKVPNSVRAPKDFPPVA